MSALRICLTVFALSTAAAQADTIVKLGTSYENRAVTEGYTGDIERMQNDIALRQQAEATELSPVPSLTLHRNIDANEAGDGKRHPVYGNEVTLADVYASVYSDHDHDGFYSRFTLNFDVDSHYGYEYVYARIYLRKRGQDYELFHVTEVFEIYDNLSSDSYKVDSKLVSNYSAALYDVRIEILVAGRTGTQDVVDANTHSSLRGLPLEAQRLDGNESGDVIVYEHAGAFSPPLLFALTILGAISIRRQRHV